MDTTHTNSKFECKLLSFEELNSSIEIWEGQRTINPNRIEEIKKFYETYYAHNHILYRFGTFIVCRFNRKYYLIDGQHRYTVLKELVSEYPELKRYEYIFEIINVDSLGEIKNHFANINESIPVPKFYTKESEMNKIYGEAVRDYISSFNTELLKMKNRPYPNWKNIRDDLYELFSDNIIDYTSKEQIKNFLRFLNGHISDEFLRIDKKHRISALKTLSKPKTLEKLNGCKLGFLSKNVDLRQGEIIIAFGKMDDL